MLIQAKINGVIYNDESLLNLVPFNVYSTKSHVETCEKLSFFVNKFSGDYEIVFINLLCVRSSFSKCISALKYLNSNKNFVVSNLKVNSVFHDFVLEELNLNVTQIETSSVFRLINHGSRLLFLLKFLTHKFYILLGYFKNPKKFKNDSVLRAWVEVSENIHGEKRCFDSTLLFYPFPYKLKRQFSFIKKCLNKGYEVGFSGINYSAYDLLKLLIKFNDKNIVNFEANGHIRHAKYLSKRIIKNYYTEDDYDASSFIISKYLIKNGANCINTAHGVNQITPFICATTYEALTIPQVEHFSHFTHNKGINFTFQGKKNIPNIDYVFSRDSSVNFVFIHSNFLESNLIYEHEFQSKAVKNLSEIVEKKHLFIKYHPNSVFRENFNVNEISNYELSQLSNKCFITIQSTSYFSFGETGTFVFIGDDLMNPFNIVGNGVPFYNIGDLKLLIEYYSINKNLINGFKDQIKHINSSKGA